MFAILLLALSAAVALASAITLADAAVRSRNAFRLLRSDGARQAEGRRITVTFVDTVVSAMPPLRPVSAVRASQRRTVRAGASQTLRAAA